MAAAVHVIEVPAVAGSEGLAVSAVTETGVAPAWLTLTARPATVAEADRPLVAALPVTAKVTVPLPVPEAPEVTDSQATLSVAVQAHPGVAVTVAVKVPPAAPSEWLAGETL